MRYVLDSDIKELIEAVGRIAQLEERLTDLEGRVGSIEARLDGHSPKSAPGISYRGEAGLEDRIAALERAMPYE